MDPLLITVLIPALPLAAFAVMLPMSQRVRNGAIGISILAMVGALALSIATLVDVFPGAPVGEAIGGAHYQVATLGGVALTLSLSLDSLAAVAMVMVTFVALCVQIFSLAYMADDRRRGWYFSVVSLFTSAMLFLVLSADLLTMFIAWEVMGLCSYLLIGFWYRDEAARRASQKAFLYTRAGDLGFIVALAAIYGATGSFELGVIFGAAATWAPALLLTVSLGLIWAAIGKSAQFPLFVWLPDAMAGPTPASALIHAATMVAAGVFMLARMMPVLELSHAALATMAWVGALTALIAGVLAANQTDLKKVLAYSTVSQLGFMFIALGAGSAIAALFHLTTHAFFKALLFLAAGAIIHATHTQDMRKMGGLARQMPVTMTTFTIGAFALAGLVPLSGFFSKDEIFHAALTHTSPIIFAIALVVGATTAFYVTKTWLTVFFGKSHTHAHEGSILEVAPLVALAIVTAGLGFFSPSFSALLGHEGSWPSIEMAITSTSVTLIGIGLGFLAWRGAFSRIRLGVVGKFIHQGLAENLRFDYAYDLFMIKPFMWFTDALWRFDANVIDRAVNLVATGYRWFTSRTWEFDALIIDGVVNGVGTLSRRLGRRFRSVQSGELGRYRYLVAAATVLLLVAALVQIVLDMPKGA